MNTMLAERCHAAGLPFQIGACHPCAQESLHRIKSASAPRTRRLPDHPARLVGGAWRRGRHLSGPHHPGSGSLPASCFTTPSMPNAVSPRRIWHPRPPSSPELLGIKVAGGDDEWYSSMRAECGDLLHLHSRPFPRHRPAKWRSWFVLQRGLHRTRLRGRLEQMALSDPEEAMEIQKEILAFLDKRITPISKAGHVNAAADKLLAHIGNWGPVSTAAPLALQMGGKGGGRSPAATLRRKS